MACWQDTLKVIKRLQYGQAVGLKLQHDFDDKKAKRHISGFYAGEKWRADGPTRYRVFAFEDADGKKLADLYDNGTITNWAHGLKLLSYHIADVIPGKTIVERADATSFVNTMVGWALNPEHIVGIESFSNDEGDLGFKIHLTTGKTIEVPCTSIEEVQTRIKALDAEITKKKHGRVKCPKK